MNLCLPQYGSSACILKQPVHQFAAGCAGRLGTEGRSFSFRRSRSRNARGAKRLRQKRSREKEGCLPRPPSSCKLPVFLIIQIVCKRICKSGNTTFGNSLTSFLSNGYPDKLELYDHSGTCYSGCPLFQNIIQFIERRSAVVNIVFHSCFHNISGRHKPYGIQGSVFCTEHI